MTVKEMALFCLELADDYLGTYQRSWDWLRSLNSGGRMDYLKQTLKNGNMVNDQEDNLTLLNAGRDELYQEFPLLHWRKLDWSGIWNVVIYDIPEKRRWERNKLRAWLKKFGFARWQESVWVSPHPVAENGNRLFLKLGLGDSCGIYESKRVVGVSDKIFANKLWHLEELNSKYDRFLSNYRDSRRQECVELLARDPMLPKELLPDDWLGEELIKRVLLKF